MNDIEKSIQLDVKRHRFLLANQFQQIINNQAYAGSIWNKYFIEYIKAVG